MFSLITTLLQQQQSCFQAKIVYYATVKQRKSWQITAGI